MTTDEKIAAGIRVKSFLADDAISGAFETLERRYYDEFLAAGSRDAIDKAHSRAKVLREFRETLVAISDAGDFEARKRERDLAAQTQNPRRK